MSRFLAKICGELLGGVEIGTARFALLLELR
jgi:hypothetical protein